MTTNSGRVIVLGCFRLIAVLVVTASPTYAQRPGPVFAPDRIEIERLGSLTLRGPGSQIGVSARDRTVSEAGDAAGILRQFAAQLQGVVVYEVRANSPASRAGLMKGDIVTMFDGQRVERASQFSRLVAETPPGWTVKMRILRGGKTRDVAITPTL
jgi:membrane-associated protease RseP (regulator of RpoE activity)